MHLGGVTVAGVTTVSNTLNVTGATNVTGALNVTGGGSFNNPSGIITTGTLNVSGATSFGDITGTIGTLVLLMMEQLVVPLQLRVTLLLTEQPQPLILLLLRRIVWQLMAIYQQAVYYNRRQRCRYNWKGNRYGDGFWLITK